LHGLVGVVASDVATNAASNIVVLVIVVTASSTATVVVVVVFVTTSSRAIIVKVVILPETIFARACHGTTSWAKEPEIEMKSCIFNYAR
jgi:hypothetical protein